MRFLVDACAGKRLADWLANQGHDVVRSTIAGPDPGDMAILEWAASELRIVVTMDKDFGRLLFVDKHPHCGVVRLPDVPSKARIDIMHVILTRHYDALENGLILTVRGGRIRVSRGV